ncbi:MAG: hypothetical protein H6579_04925 [Chitinophagales bacterium]|nr:hypothetical protein [Chitinophagales bacterium]
MIKLKKLDILYLGLGFVLLFITISTIYKSAILFSELGICFHTRTLVLLALLSVFFVFKHKRIASLFFISFFLEFSLSFISPYRSYPEKNGSNKYTSPLFTRAPTPFNPGSSLADEKIEFHYVHHFNDLGYQDQNPRSKIFKAFLLGDSFVQGVGTDSLHTIDKQLEKKIGCDNCIMSLGLSGSDLVTHFAQFQKVVENGYHAEYALLNLNYTDLFEISIRTKEIKEIEQRETSLAIQFLYGYSYLIRHLCHDVFRLNYNFLNPKEQELLYSEIHVLILNYIYKYKEYCDHNNINLIVVFQPCLEECTSKIYQLDQEISLIMADTSVWAINMNNYFNNACLNYYWPIDGHFTTEGYTFYSEKLYEEIIKLDNDFKH